MSEDEYTSGLVNAHIELLGQARLFSTKNLEIIFESMRESIFELKNEIIKRERENKKEANNG